MQQKEMALHINRIHLLNHLQRQMHNAHCDAHNRSHILGANNAHYMRLKCVIFSVHYNVHWCYQG